MASDTGALVRNGAILPDELLIRVFEILDEDASHRHELQDHQDFDKDTHTHRIELSPRYLATHASRVCRRWWLLAQKIIYTNVTLQGEETFDLFKRTLQENQSLGQWTRTLSMHGLTLPSMLQEQDDVERERSDAQTQLELSSMLPHLQTLCLRSHPRDRGAGELPSNCVAAISRNLAELCLHGFCIIGPVLSKLPETLTRLSLECCYLFKVGTLCLPNLQSLKVLSAYLYGGRSELEENSLVELSALTELSFDLEMANEHASRIALMSVLPRVEKLRVRTGFGRTDLSAYFKVMHSRLYHLVIEGNLERNDILALPPSLRTFTWRQELLEDSYDLPFLLRQLIIGHSLPHLESLPVIEASTLYLRSNYKRSPSSYPANLEAYDYLRQVRQLPESTRFQRNKDLSIWEYVRKQVSK